MLSLVRDFISKRTHKRTRSLYKRTRSLDKRIRNLGKRTRNLGKRTHWFRTENGPKVWTP